MAQHSLLAEPPPLAERPKPRKRALLSGTVVHSQGRFSFACTIRDTSVTGARIAFAGGNALPGEIYLINRRGNTVHRCDIAWMRNNEAGLEFRSSDNMAALPDSLAFLRRFGAPH